MHRRKSSLYFECLNRQVSSSYGYDKVFPQKLLKGESVILVELKGTVNHGSRAIVEAGA